MFSLCLHLPNDETILPPGQPAPCLSNKAALSFPLILDEQEQSLGLPVGKLPGCSLLSQVLPRVEAFFRSSGGRQWTGLYLMGTLPPAKPCEQL